MPTSAAHRTEDLNSTPTGTLRQWLITTFNRTADVDANGKITITPRQIYIIPTRFGFAFGVMLIAMFIGANNYEINLGFVLSFLLAGIGLAALLQTWANLSRLELTPGATQPVFCGENAEFVFHFHNHRAGGRPGIQLLSTESINDTESVAFDLNTQQPQKVICKILTMHRGRLQPDRWQLFTRFPLHMFYSWAFFTTHQDCIVYPTPAPRDQALDQLFRASSRLRVPDNIEFRGHRQYQVGDNPRRIDWKALARDRGMLVKEYFDQQDNDIWLDWDDIIPQDPEQRLAILCRAVIELTQTGTRFGLRIPGAELDPTSGSRHYTACLTALALFGQ